MYLDFSKLDMRYQPFPIGVARPVMDPGRYQDFLAAFPDLDIFDDYATLGNPGAKLTLSEKENPKKYRSFVDGAPLWRDFYRWIKSPDFIYGVMRSLAAVGVDLGYTYLSPAQRVARVIKDRGINSFIRNPPLRSRFEFSILRGNGGHLPPHTDAPSKVVTIIVAMGQPGEWDARHGGGTDINMPRDATKSFNQVNRVVDFDEMEVLHTYPFEPNQAIVFVKTFNSWHSVRPITAGDPDRLRKTLTINIERCR